MSRPRAPLHAVILAGGAGARLWPRSRGRDPKPLLRVDGQRSLLEAALARARGFAAPERIWIVCVREQRAVILAASGLPARQLIVEPRRCNTAMAVALAAHRIAEEQPEALLAVLPADHLVPDARAFATAIRRAAAAVRSQDVLVTLGVAPTRPETGYGYIQLGAPAAAPHGRLHQVRRFVEKPDRGRARRYLRSGSYRWNAGVFVWSARAILEEIAAHAKPLHRALAPLRAFRGGARGRRAAVEASYARAPSVSIDNAVLEHSRRVWCLPVDFRWSDVGTWQSLAEVLGVGPGTTCVIEGEAVLHDSGGNLVWAGDRPVALLGVEGLAVIDAGDALLVASLERSGDVRAVVERLRSQGRSDLI